MKKLLTLALLGLCTGALAADKPATKPATPSKTESKAEMKTPPAEAKDLKVEEPDQKDPKNKHQETKANGEVKKGDI